MTVVGLITPLCAHRSSQTTEEIVLKARAKHSSWGGRKLNRWLIEQGHTSVPCPSTITEILRRHGKLTPIEERVYPWKRFERAVPNALWQMDFKGDFGLLNGRCYPLTVLDDHSRFGIALQACNGTRHDAVKALSQKHLEPWITRTNQCG